MVEFWVGVVCGFSLAGLLWILVAPSRRARAETGMDRTEEARLLLGERADESLPSESGSSDASPVDHPRQYDAAELQALRRLGQGRRSRRR